MEVKWKFQCVASKTTIFKNMLPL